MRSDSELTEGVLGGEPAAFAELVRRHERVVYGVSLAVLGDHHSAEDAAQETFMMAYEKLGSLRNGSAFGAWVLRIEQDAWMLFLAGGILARKEPGIVAGRRSNGKSRLMTTHTRTSPATHLSHHGIYR